MVAAEVREIAGNVGLIADELQAELAGRIEQLGRDTETMASEAVGSRLVDLALKAIELIDRNLSMNAPATCAGGPPTAR